MSFELFAFLLEMSGGRQSWDWLSCTLHATERGTRRMVELLGLLHACAFTVSHIGSKPPRPLA